MTTPEQRANHRRPWEYSAFAVTLTRTQRLSPGFVRVTLGGEALRDFAPWGLDQRIKLVLPMPDGRGDDFGLLDDPTPHPRQWYARWKSLPEDRRNVLRTYTPAAIRPECGEIDVDLFIHQPAGPASTWALSAQIGDPIVVTGPDRRVGWTGYGIGFAPPVAPSRVLLVGDESALPAISNIVESLGHGTPADVLLSLTDVADDTLGRRGTHTAVRVEHVPPDGDGLLAAVRGWGTRNRDAVSDPDLYVWIAGESTTTTRIRRHLTGAHALPKDRVAFLGYWKTGGPLVG